jgi:hypothetical protein
VSHRTGDFNRWKNGRVDSEEADLPKESCEEWNGIACYCEEHAAKELSGEKTGCEDAESPDSPKKHAVENLCGKNTLLIAFCGEEGRHPY